MELTVAGLAFALAVSLWLNGWQWFIDRRGLKRRLQAALEAAKRPGEPTYDCRELLHDLTEGVALVKVTRISPMDVFVRRS